MSSGNVRYDANKVLDSLKEIKGFKTDSALSNYLEVSKSTVSMWRKDNRVSIDLIVDKFRDLPLNRLLSLFSDSVVGEIVVDNPEVGKEYRVENEGRTIVITIKA